MNKHNDIPSILLEGDIESGIDAIRELADGMRDAFDLSLNGVITLDEHRNTFENAYNWLVRNYQTCAGAIHAIYFIANTISTPFINGDAEIICTKKKTEEISK